jgi:hypothetical protein
MNNTTKLIKYWGKKKGLELERALPGAMKCDHACFLVVS